MNAERKCYICGSEKIAEIDRDNNQYKCKSCSSYLTFEKPSNVVRQPKEEEALFDLSKRERFFNNLMGTVVEIRAFFEGNISAGTAFFISKQYALTNAHVLIQSGESGFKIDDVASQIVGKNYGQEGYFPFELIAADLEFDIAIIKLNHGQNNFVSFSEKIFNGEQVFAIGNAKGKGLSITEGVISDVERIVNQKKFFLTSTFVTEGNSGCPVFNVRGELVGMVTAGIKDTVLMNYAIPAKTLLGFVSAVENKEEIKII